MCLPAATGVFVRPWFDDHRSPALLLAADAAVYCVRVLGVVLTRAHQAVRLQPTWTCTMRRATAGPHFLQASDKLVPIWPLRRCRRAWCSLQEAIQV